MTFDEAQYWIARLNERGMVVRDVVFTPDEEGGGYSIVVTGPTGQPPEAMRTFVTDGEVRAVLGSDQ